MAVELNSNICFCKDGTIYKTRAIPSKDDITADHYLCFRKNATTFYVPLMLTETLYTIPTPMKVLVNEIAYSVVMVAPSVSIEYSYRPSGFIPGLLNVRSVTIASAFTTDLPYTIKYTDETHYIGTLTHGTLAAGEHTFSGGTLNIMTEDEGVTNVEIKLGSWSYNFAPYSGSDTITTRFD